MFSAGHPTQSMSTKNLSKPEEGGLHSTQLKRVISSLKKVFRINLLAMLSAVSFMAVHGPPLQREENLRIWKRAGFKRGVQ